MKPAFGLAARRSGCISPPPSCSRSGRWLAAVAAVQPELALPFSNSAIRARNAVISAVWRASCPSSRAIKSPFANWLSTARSIESLNRQPRLASLARVCGALRWRRGSAAQGGAGRLGDLGDDAGGDGLDLGVGQGPLGGLQDDGDGDRLLAVAERRRRRRRRRRGRRRSAPGRRRGRRAPPLRRRRVRSTTKAKSRSTGWNADSAQRRPAPCRPSPSPARASRNTSKATTGPATSSVRSTRGWISPKRASTCFGPRLQRRRSGRGDTSRRIGAPRRASRPGRPAASSTASASALASKASTGRAGSAQCAGRLRPVRIAGGDHRLLLRPVAGVLRADLEQRRVAQAAVGVAPRPRAIRLGSSDGRITSRSALIGLTSRSAAGAAAERLGRARRHERVGHRLDQPARGQRAGGRGRAGAAPA